MNTNLKCSRLALLLILVLVVLIKPSVAASELDDHPSPYLRLHAADPVQWRSWGEPVMQQAASDDRLILLSIGYYACHWCHVMQRESYQNEEVANFLNQHFVAVKVDRELRPELDRRMIDFVENLTGHAGWPLNVFLTPDGYPVTGFTYLPRDNFLDVLKKLTQQWRGRRAEIHAAARGYFEEIDKIESRTRLMTLPEQHYPKLADAFVSQAMLIADEMQGGFGEVAKFPSYPQMAALLELIRVRPGLDPDVGRFVRLTLDTMASRHLMDHLHGGFFRYVTDPDWATPHFEKMLYDNALLARLYFDAHVLWPERGYADVGLSTVRFMLNFLADGEGGFFSSLSAVDENDLEGGGYYWTLPELQRLLNRKELAAFRLPGNLAETRSILLPPLMDLGDSGGLGEAIKSKLKQAQKPRMPADEKRLASWNALALEALLLAETHSAVLAEARHSDRLYRFIRKNFMRDGGLQRLSESGERAETTLEDYAFVARALQFYANQRASKQAAALALKLVEQAFEKFYVRGLWRHTETSLIPGEAGEAVIQDGVLSSPLTVLLEAVALMPEPNPALRGLAGLMSERLTPDMLELPYHYGSFIMLNYRRLVKDGLAE